MRYIRIGGGLAAVAGLGVVTDMVTLLVATGAFFAGSAVLVTAYYSGRAQLRHAEADVIRARRCDPMNSAFYPPAPAPAPPPAPKPTAAPALGAPGPGEDLRRLG